MADIKFSEFPEYVEATPTSFIVGYDSDANENIRIPANNMNAVDLTYAELVSAIGTAMLIKGKPYIITDYQTIYDQPDYESDGTPKTTVSTLSGPTEPLLVTATSENTISPLAFSNLNPSDIIYYDYAFDQTEIMGQPAKGRITRRIDTEINISAPYDFREVVFIRYESAPGSGIFNQYKDNGGASNAAIPTFGIDCYNTTLGDITLIQPGQFILPNTIFGNYSYNNIIGNGFVNNTIESNFYNNTIGNYFSNNTIGNSFRFNNIGLGFSNNTIGIGFGLNTIGDYFYNSTIGNSFSINNIGNYWGDEGPNIIGDNFYNNTIGNNFGSNTIGYNFNYNNIGNDFGSNTIGNNFYYNTIGTSFNSNTIGNLFYFNNIDNSFYGNTIGINFIYNTIGIYFFNNNIENNFQANTIGINFNSNSSIGSYFQYNDKIGRAHV